MNNSAGCQRRFVVIRDNSEKKSTSREAERAVRRPRNPISILQSWWTPAVLRKSCNAVLEIPRSAVPRKEPCTTPEKRVRYKQVKLGCGPCEESWSRNWDWKLISP